MTDARVKERESGIEGGREGGEVLYIGMATKKASRIPGPIGKTVLNNVQGSKESVIFAYILVSKEVGPRVDSFAYTSCRCVTECDRTFVSQSGGPQNGTFSSPTLDNPSGHSRQCVYTFVAGPHQRVQITFDTFNLRGTPPE